jgi:ribosomal protein L11 methyltransferase
VLYFLSEARARGAARRAARVLELAGHDPARAGLEVRRVEEEPWVERYQAGLRPFGIGARFVVDPTGVAARRPGRTVLRLVPGRAFGTGEHPTTRLAVRALERQVQRGERWIDLGCGSGILALVAAHCGAGEVLALDVDAEAVALARRVVRQNGVAHVVRVRRGSHDAARVRGWDGIVANIELSYFLRAAPQLVRLLGRAGRLIATGFLAEERQEAGRALESAGLRVIERSSRAGWSLCVCRPGSA